ncbi:MAG: hypothetical protein HYW57_02575 [Ignavibacteriales bacterium]|nr:hypothetical protein [Ignavibacteriales bacterium]
MAAERGTRKLAAIMFTDIKSFSKKMSENEELAMQLLRVHDDTLKAVIEKHEGKIIKAIGDAFMVDFSSAVNAVKCAIEAQEEFYRYNEGKKELEKIEVRIGVHLGDVITDGSDIFGDGVNIAARIEAVTEANRICISHDVFSQIKNKMQVETFHMGSIDLKNIPEPVEVYEILLSNIPEFSTPSKTAQQMPSRRTAEKTTKREAKEAEKIEVAKKKAEEDRLKAEKESQAKIEKLYSKAEKLVNEGKPEEAETEINEIFKLVAFHAGAQVLQGRIEEERERKAEEERKGQAAKKKVEQKITELMKDAMTMVEGDNYPEALLKVREVFSIDANYGEARELEKQILEAQKASEELERQESVEEQGGETAVDRGETLEIPQVGEGEAPPTAAPLKPAAPPARPPVGLRPRRRRKIPQGARTLLGLAVLVILGVVFFPNLQKILFPQDTTIVVAPFEFPAGVPDTSNIGGAIAGILSEDLARYREIVVVRPLSGGSPRVAPREAARELQTRYVLSGNIVSVFPKFAITLRLELTDMNATAWERTIESEPFSLSNVRREALAAVLAAMELEIEPYEPFRLSGDPFINEQYLLCVALTSGNNYNELLHGIDLLRGIVRHDSTFSTAYVTLGRALLRQYKLEGEWNKGILRDAADAALRGRGLNANLPGVYEVLGAAYRSAGQYGAALSNLERSLELQPGNAETYRQLALLALVEGKYDRGLEHASKAGLLEPKSPDTHETLGHMYYFKQQLNRAQSAYDHAIVYGGSPYLITTRYKMAVWGAGLSPEPVAEYCNRLLRQDANNYVLKYWIGRAYMLSGLWSQAKGYLESGAEVLKSLIEERPDDPEVRCYLGLYYARLGESAKGLAEIDKALELNNGPLMMYRKAQFFAIQSGKQKEALEWLRSAVQQEFILAEVMSPDFAFIVKEPAFTEAISLRIPPRGEN